MEIHINGILIDYTIEYYINEENSSRVTAMAPNTIFYFLLEDLNNFTTYNVSVSANTVVGRGPSTERTQRTNGNGKCFYPVCYDLFGRTCST